MDRRGAGVPGIANLLQSEEERNGGSKQTQSYVETTLRGIKYIDEGLLDASMRVARREANFH
jgi:hypothetical protein